MTDRERSNRYYWRHRSEALLRMGQHYRKSSRRRKQIVVRNRHYRKVARLAEKMLAWWKETTNA